MTGHSKSMLNVHPLRCWAIAAIAALSVVVGSTRADDSQTQAGLPEGVTLIGIKATPAEINFADRFVYEQLLLTGYLEDGKTLDVTRIAERDVPGDIVQVSAKGLVRPVADGQGELKFTIGNQTVTVGVTVTGSGADQPVSYIRDVTPLMSKMGCNAGTCHGSAKGKNGFKLSLRGYDPVFDHRALTDDLAARRINRSAPDRSLMLLKICGGVPHVGGVLTRLKEPRYQIFRDWIARGVALDLDSPRVTGIEIFPKNPTIALAGMSQQMKVIATFSDGAVRDVTADTFIESGNIDVADADNDGVIEALRRGEAAVLARYQGNYAATSLVVMGDRSGFEWQDAPTHNFVDELVYEKLQTVKVLPGELTTDAEFLRRIYLDLTGLPPRPGDVRAFLADERDTRVKRDEMIDRLIGGENYVNYWAHKWSDLLQVNRKFLSEKGAWTYSNWIRHAVAANVPYDKFAYTILTASGSTFENPPASYYRVLREPGETTENTTQLFLGVRFSCNKCHDHPFERWTQNQYYSLAAYFGQIGRKKGPNPGEEVIYDTRSAGAVKHLGTGQVVQPEFPFTHSDVAPEDANLREQFAHWVTSPENEYFAKSYVNRLWAYLMGVGLIDPIDDIRAGNPPSNPRLLDRLTIEFVESGFDAQHMIRLITKSRVYQQSIQTNEWNEDDAINYSHAIARRLPAEVLFDAVQLVTGANAKLPGMPAGSHASQLPDSSVKLPGGFLDLFGRPPRESACECERGGGVALAQALNLINGPTIADAIAAPNNRIARLAESIEDDARLVDELFVAILSRTATESETTASVEAIRAAESRLAGAQDIAWALINSPAFLFNY